MAEPLERQPVTSPAEHTGIPDIADHIADEARAEGLAQRDRHGLHVVRESLSSSPTSVDIELVRHREAIAREAGEMIIRGGPDSARRYWKNFSEQRWQ